MSESDNDYLPIPASYSEVNTGINDLSDFPPKGAEPSRRCGQLSAKNIFDEAWQRNKYNWSRRVNMSD